MTPNVLSELPQRLKKGDIGWLKTQYESGALDDLRQHLTPEAWAGLGKSIEDGDIKAVRTHLSGVTIAGVGPLVVKKSNRGWIIAIIAVLLLGIAALVVWLVSSNNDDDEAKPTKDIPATLAADKQYSTFSNLLHNAGLDAVLATPGPFTVFPPNNAAFSAVPADELAQITNNPDTLKQFLLYHVAASSTALTVSDLKAGPLKMVEGQDAAITKSGDTAKINDATVVNPDVEATNGIIQGIDKVLIPPDLLAERPTMNIIQLLQSNPDYSIYTGLITQAGLNDVLNQAGPFTLFAPNNAAFEAVDQAKLAAVESDPTQLRNLLNYTIVEQALTTEQMQPGPLPTAQGAPITVSIDTTGAATVYMVDAATIIQANVLATNGVFQGIDKVIVPPGTDIAPKPTLNIVQLVGSLPDYTTLSKLLNDAGMTTLLGETGPYTLFGANNKAWAALPAEQMTYLQSNIPLLRQVLSYSLVLGDFPTSKLKGGTLNSVEGSTLNITVNGSVYKVNTATIVQPDLLATNGVVQGIDQVLVPPGVDLNPPPPATTTTSVAPTTSAPPTTAAPPSTTAGAGTSVAPPPTTAAPAPTTAAPPPTTAAPAGDNLYKVISSDPDFSFFTQLIDAANLQDRLANANQITVFAPTNGAFGPDPTSAQDRVNNLKAALTPDQLAQLLSYAGAPATYPVSSLKNGQQIATFLTTPSAQSLSVVGSGASAQIKGAQNTTPANIVHPDVKASNGLVQGIDRFLVPNGVTLPPV
jgi:uncharacterized surface protein with fasciclin (FAS1) repeats